MVKKALGDTDLLMVLKRLAYNNNSCQEYFQTCYKSSQFGQTLPSQKVPFTAKRLIDNYVIVTA